MSRVLHLITTLQSGGAQTMLANVVARMSATGSTPSVVVEMTASGEGGAQLRRGGVPVYSLNMARGRVDAVGLAVAIARFGRLLRRERPSIVQTWLYHADLMGLLAVPILRVPVVWNIRSAWHLGLQSRTTRLCARLSMVPAAVIVNSRAGERVHREIGYRPRRWCLIGNGFDTDTFKPDERARAEVREELGVGGATPVIGLVGRWDPHKDHATFLVAAAILKERFADVHFVLIGEGLTRENRTVIRTLEDLNLSSSVHLLGRRTDIPRITAALDIASCTSVGEAFPNVVGEAMSAGVPCVSTDVGDAALLLDDVNFIVAPRDPKALAAAWLRILSLDIAERRAVGMRARERIRRYYSLEGIVAQYEQLYAELVSTPRGRMRSARRTASS